MGGRRQPARLATVVDKPATPPQASRAPAGGRPYWTGQLRLALVALPVKVYSAAKSGTRVPLHQVDARTGKRVRHDKVGPGAGPVDRDEILMGFEVKKGEYVLLEPEEIAALKVESRQTLELVQFVDEDEIGPIWYEKPFYVVPDGELAEDGFVVVREALRRTRKVGLGQMTMRGGGESIVAVRARGRGLLLETLRFPDEIKKADALFAGLEDVPPDEQLVGMAVELIERKTAPFDASRFHDHYSEALRASVGRPGGRRRSA